MGVVTSAVTMVASTTDAASVTTSAYTPLVNDLLVLLVGATGFIREPPRCVITNSVAGLPGWVPVCRAVFNGSVDSVLAFVGAAKQGQLQQVSRTTTINFDGVTVTGNFWGIYRISGMQRTGLGAIRQFAIQQNGAAAGTPGPVFPAACLTGNPVVAILGNGTNPATVTPPTGMTETIDTGYATPTAGFEAAFASSGITASTLSWGSTSGTAFGALALELDTRDLTADDEPSTDIGWGALQ
jgi:hypothetical protein